jgi:hypothetical protein
MGRIRRCASRPRLRLSQAPIRKSRRWAVAAHWGTIGTHVVERPSDDSTRSPRRVVNGGFPPLDLHASKHPLQQGQMANEACESRGGCNWGTSRRSPLEGGPYRCVVGRTSVVGVRLDPIVGSRDADTRQRVGISGTVRTVGFDTSMGGGWFIPRAPSPTVDVGDEEGRSRDTNRPPTTHSKENVANAMPRRGRYSVNRSLAWWFEAGPRNFLSTPSRLHLRP